VHHYNRKLWFLC